MPLNTSDEKNSDNGKVPSGKKSLPEPILTKIYVNIWYHKAIMSQNVLMYEIVYDGITCQIWTQMMQ